MSFRSLIMVTVAGDRQEAAWNLYNLSDTPCRPQAEEEHRGTLTSSQKF